VATISNPGNWTDELGSSVDLHTPLVADDSHYDKSPGAASSSGFTVQLGSPAVPVSGTPVLSLLARKADNYGVVNLTVNLRTSSGTLIQSFSGGALDNISATETQVNLTVTNAISNYSALRVEIIATQVS
jgi:hypothetical protein